MPAFHTAAPHPLFTRPLCPQLLFSLFVAIAVFSHSPFGLPFAVVGLWKFGFPETTLAFLRAFILVVSEGRVSRDSLLCFVNGVGTVLHHLAAAWLIVCLTTGLMPFGRTILSVTLPLLAQHVVVLLKYHSMPLYAAIEFCLEVAWEWEIFSQQPNFNAAHGFHRYSSAHGTTLMMLLAHWRAHRLIDAHDESAHAMSSTRLKLMSSCRASTHSSRASPPFQVLLVRRGPHLARAARVGPPPGGAPQFAPAGEHAGDVAGGH